MRTVEEVGRLRGKTVSEVRRGSVLGALPAPAPEASLARPAEVEAVNAVENAFESGTEEMSDGQ